MINILFIKLVPILANHACSTDAIDVGSHQSAEKAYCLVGG
jgi:hypothetical protein